MSILIQRAFIFSLVVFLISCEDQSTNEPLLSKSQDLSCLTEEQTTCVQQNKEHLELKINSVNPIPIKDTSFFPTVSGECSLGGYTKHNIKWKLYKEGSSELVRKSTGQIDCKNGRFSFRIGICPTEGTSCAFTHLHKAEIELVAYEGSILLTNPNRAKKTINLVP